MWPISMFSLPLKQFISYLRGEDKNDDIESTGIKSASYQDRTEIGKDADTENRDEECGKVLNEKQDYQQTYATSEKTHRHGAGDAVQLEMDDTCSNDSFENISLTDLDYTLKNLSNSLNMRHSLSEVVNEEKAMIRELTDTNDGLNTQVETETTFIKHDSVSKQFATNRERIFSASASTTQNSATEIHAIVIEKDSLSGDSVSDIDMTFTEQEPSSEYSPTGIYTDELESLDSANELYEREGQFAFEDFLATNTRQTQFKNGDTLSRDASVSSPELDIPDDMHAASLNSRAGHTNLAFIPETNTVTDDEVNNSRPFSGSVENEKSARSHWQKIKKSPIGDTKTGQSAKIIWPNPTIATRLLQSYARVKERRKSKGVTFIDVVRTVHRRRLANRLKSFVDINISKSFHFSTRKYYDIDEEKASGQEDGRYQNLWWKKKPKTGREKIRQYKFFGMVLWLLFVTTRNKSPFLPCSNTTLASGSSQSFYISVFLLNQSLLENVLITVFYARRYYFLIYVQYASLCLGAMFYRYTVMALSFRTVQSGQTVYTHCRSSLIRFYTVCSSVCIFWMNIFLLKHIARILGWLQQFFGIWIFRTSTAFLSYQADDFVSIINKIRAEIYQVQNFSIFHCLRMPNARRLAKE